MKKFTKVSLIIACVTAALGIVLCIASLALGFSFDKAGKALERGAFNVSFDNGIDIGFGNNITLDESVEEPVVLDKPMDLVMDVGGAEVKIEQSDDGKFFVDAEGINMKWNIQDDEIVVQTGSKHQFVFFHNGSVGEVTVHVPKDYRFKDVEIECGAGSLNMDMVQADSIDIQLGAGEVIAKKIVAGSLDIECGAGSVDISGSVKDNADIECSMGEVSLDVEQEEKYYNYDIECSMGEVKLNDSSYSGIGVEKYIDNSSKHEMSIECSMGEISVTTGGK